MPAVEPLKGSRNRKKPLPLETVNWDVCTPEKLLREKLHREGDYELDLRANTVEESGMRDKYDAVGNHDARNNVGTESGVSFPMAQWETELPPMDYQDVHVHEDEYEVVSVQQGTSNQQGESAMTPDVENLRAALHSSSQYLGSSHHTFMSGLKRKRTSRVPSTVSAISRDSQSDGPRASLSPRCVLPTTTHVKYTTVP